MGKSARVMGWEFGRTAREMNVLLKEHGYLEGNPGAYGLTDKGRQYAKEEDHSRGTGGYAHYNPAWETRTWNDDTAAALAADMASAPPTPGPENHQASADRSGGDRRPAREWTEPTYPSTPGQAPGVDPKAALIVMGVLLAGRIAAPHVKPLWHNKVVPAAVWLRDKAARRKPEESAAVDDES